MHSCFYQYPMFQCFRFVLLFFYLSCSFCSLSSPVVYGIFLLFCFTLIFFCCLDCLTYSFFLFLSSYFNWMVFLFFSFHFALCYVYMPCSCYCFTEFFFHLSFSVALLLVDYLSDCSGLYVCVSCSWKLLVCPLDSPCNYIFYYTISIIKHLFQFLFFALFSACAYSYLCAYARRNRRVLIFSSRKTCHIGNKWMKKHTRPHKR